MTSFPKPPSDHCPCGRPGPVAACCGSYIAGYRSAGDPETLMRSRFTAYSLGTPEALEYLVATHHEKHRGANVRASLRSSVASVDSWDTLEIHAAHQDGDRGTVDFSATYHVGNARKQMREHSAFVRENGTWLYTTGTVR